MSLTLVRPPAIEPLSLPEAKAWLRLDSDDEDAVVAALVAAAREAVETAAGRRLISQTWLWRIDRWPRSAVLHAPVSPLLAAGPVTLDGAPLPSPLEADLASDPPRLLAPPDRPAPAAAFAGIGITLVAGYGALAADVPQPLRQAVRLTLAALFESRGDAPPSALPLAALPPAALALVAPYRRSRL